MTSDHQQVEGITESNHTMSSTAPTPYGRRLLVTQVDHLAEISPHKIYASYPRSPDFSGGFRDVTYKELANAVNRGAIWLEKTLGGRSTTFDTVAYIGEGDIRYFILILASHKTGHKLLLLSPRNSLEGQLNLIDKTACRTMIRSTSVVIDDILGQRQLQCFVVPSLDEFLDATPVTHIPYERTFEQAHTDPYVVYHSSGSTGLPKPIVSPQDAACTVDALNTVPPLDGREVFYPHFAKICPRFFSSLPFFHAAGVILGLCQPVYFGNTVVFGHPARPMNSGLVDEIIDHGRIDGVFLPPSILEEMTKTESSLERISQLKMVFIGTGPLSTAAGRMASEKTFLVIGAGSTEAHLWVTHTPEPEDWQYFMIGEAAAGIEMRSDSDRGLFEMVYVRRPECEHLQAIFKTFRDLDEYPTGDLFAPHPTKCHLWRSVGRRDDMLVLANGEKVQPGPIQDIVSGHKAVRDALVVGHGKFQVAAILELRDYPLHQKDARKLMDEIWPTVEEANRLSPAHGRLLRPFVMFASPEKPFIRVAKGSLSKPSTLSLYADEIEQLFARGESGMALDIEPLNFESHTLLQKSLKPVCESVIGKKKLDSIDEDFFLAGADSLAALTLAATLKRSFSAQMDAKMELINSRLIYQHSTLRKLSSAVMDVIHKPSDMHIRGKNNQDLIENLIERVTREAWVGETPNAVTNGSALNDVPNTVLLTGSTGSLGSYILDILISDKNVSKVYCFNRAEDGQSRQMNANRDRGLSTDFGKVLFVKGDLSRPNFGLSSQLCRAMAGEVSHIIHAQWPVDFNLSITAFEPHIHGVANLAAFAWRAPLRPLLCFLSSIGSVENWTEEHDITSGVPEQSFSDTTIASSGYGLSKLAASLVLDRATGYGLRSIIVRIGQIAGPADRGIEGIWPKQEWLPSLVASSRHLGLVPESLGGAETVDWIPVDKVAQTVYELAVSPEASGYAHIVSPQSTTWNGTILPAIQEYYKNSLETVPFSDWVTALEKSAINITSEGMSRNPAVKLLDFYQSLTSTKAMPHLETIRAQALSPSLRECKSVSKSDMLRWLATWNF